MLQIILGQEKPQYIYSVQLKEGATAILLPEIQKGLNILGELTNLQKLSAPSARVVLRVFVLVLLLS